MAKKTQTKSSCRDAKEKKAVKLNGTESNSKSVGMDVLCADISTSTSVSKPEIKEIIDAYWLSVQENIAKGNTVNIHGVGTFRGQRRNVKGKVLPVVKFALSSSFKRAVVGKLKSASVFPLYESKSILKTN